LQLPIWDTTAPQADAGRRRYLGIGVYPGGVRVGAPASRPNTCRRRRLSGSEGWNTVAPFGNRSSAGVSVTPAASPAHARTVCLGNEELMDTKDGGRVPAASGAG